MTGLIELKEKLKNFYAEHEVVMRPIVKFLAVLVSLMVIKSNIGYMNIISFSIFNMGYAGAGTGSRYCGKYIFHVFGIGSLGVYCNAYNVPVLFQIYPKTGSITGVNTFSIFP